VYVGWELYSYWATQIVTFHRVWGGGNSLKRVNRTHSLAPIPKGCSTRVEFFMAHFKSHLSLDLGNSLFPKSFRSTASLPWVPRPSYPWIITTITSLFWMLLGFVYAREVARELRWSVASRSLACQASSVFTCIVNNSPWQVYIQKQDDVFFFYRNMMTRRDYSRSLTY